MCLIYIITYVLDITSGEILVFNECDQNEFIKPPPE